MRAARVDANHGEVVAALRKAGCTVQSLASIGKGCPDLLVGKDGRTFTIEVKGPKGQLTPDQVKWINEWQGVVHIVRTVDDALQLVGEA
jgi:Holliday junction resolvase